MDSTISAQLSQIITKIDSIGTSNISVTVLGTILTVILLPGGVYFISKIINRQIQHYNSLITLESQLNEMYGVIIDNLYLIPGFSESIKKGNISWNRLKTITVDKSHLEKLADLELINGVFTLFYTIRRINDDTENLLLGYDEIKKAYIEKYMSLENYIANAIFISKQLEILEFACKETSSDIFDLLTKIRIQIRKDIPFVVKLQNKFLTSSIDTISFKEFNEEKQKLHNEIEDSAKDPKSKIDKSSKKKRK